MGVITYLFHRSEEITPQRFNVFFLDVGENIHIHYRDLRIELSTGEFEEIAAGFAKYAPSVLAMIRDEGYQDGVLPNTNASDTLRTFWDKGKLAHPVKYNECRLSIEENVDGFHIHFRNYKLLLDRTSFEEFARGMTTAMLQIDHKPALDPARLLELNDLAPTLLSRENDADGEAIALAVDKAFLGKADQALTGVGFVRQGSKKDGLYSKGKQRVRLQATTGKTDAGINKQLPAQIGLPEFIDNHAALLTPEQLNELKLKLLFLFKRAEAGHIPPFRIEDIVVNMATNTPVVDLFRAPANVKAAAEYSRLSTLLTGKKLFFVKPAKVYFSQEQRAALKARLIDYIRDEIAVHPCVNRIYLLGSSTKDRSGVYKVPFVHFDWVKLASDFDLLIELEPDYEDAIPATWEKKFNWANNSSVYSHLGDLGRGMESEYAQRYPGVRFFEFMLETYLFHPSKGNRAVKDDYLRRIAAQTVFERPGIIDWFEQNYPYRIDNIRRFKAASYNKVYDITSEAGHFALKLYLTHNCQDKDGQQLAYEMALSEGLAEFDLNIPAPVRNREGAYISAYQDNKAALFQFVSGKYLHEPGTQESYIAGQLLARIHLYGRQVEIPAAIAPPRIADTLLYWLNAYKDYVGRKLLPEAPLLEMRIADVNRAALGIAHCHGDVSPRNYLFRDGQCWLIDFQNSGLGSALLDLSDGMIEFAARGKGFNPDALAAFLAGYQSIQPLGEDEMAELLGLLQAQALTKQARLARGHDYGNEWKGDLIASLQCGLAWLDENGLGG
ncbi:MAG: phosphotransferase [Thiobacillus sp.]|nr:phosphotransferase [Thiobacillus sp.]